MLVDVSELLKLLNDQYQSGEALARHLGISRAGIWKQSESLRLAGYPIDVLKGKGYRLLPGTPTPTALEPLLKGSFGRAYRYLPSTGSTQDEAKRWANDEGPEGAVVLAEQQANGRGRRGRPWDSKSGSSLTFSLLLRPKMPLASLPLLPLAGGLAVCEAAGVGGLKWPNDLLAADGRKMAGILLEAHISGEEAAYVILGIGINVHKPAPEGAAAIDEFARVSRAELLARFLEKFETRYRQLHQDSETVLEAYRAYSYTIGRDVTVNTPEGDVQGRAIGIAPDGSLQVRLANKAKIRSISAGDVQLIERT